MIITNNTIEFKSSNRFFEKEKSGIKNNTVRKLYGIEKEIFLDNLRFLKFIKITTLDLSAYFEREIKDISFYQDLIIFTWSQE